MTTIREVAERAGVSLTTVSHVINNTRFVSEEKKLRVQEAMQELNYRPNALARSLRSGKTHTLGLILPDSSNPFFADIGRSLEATAFDLGFSVILCNTEGDPSREEFYVDVLSKKQVDGMIFVATGDQANSLNLLLEENIPVVVVDRCFPEIEVDTVITDNRLGGQLATQHLIELGHKRIACITGPSNLTPSAERVTGYQEAVEEAGIALDPALIMQGDYHPKSGQNVTSAMLKLKNPPSAIFACNDLMAIGAMRAVVAAGLRVPEDISIIGFDDIELARYSTPPLTTIAQPILEIGSEAARLMVDRIKDEKLLPQQIVLPTRLVLRESTTQRITS